MTGLMHPTNNLAQAVTTPTDSPELLVLPQRQKVVLVIDLVESVRLMAANELAVVDHWRGFVRHATTQVLPLHEGRMVKSLGDGLMVEFESPRNATNAAMQLHRYFDTANAALPPGQQLYLRAGLNTAQVYIDDIDIYGSGVNLAARVASLAGPGETMVTAEVRDGLTDGLDASIEDMGECYLKHITEPQRVYRVGGDQKSTLPQVLVSDQTVVPPALAVMSFSSLSPSPHQWAIGDLLADGINAVLSRGKQFKLISRLSLRPFDHDSKRIADAEKILGVDYALTGTYLTLHDEIDSKLILSANLHDTKSQEIIWTDQFAGQVADLLQSHNELAQQIANGAQQAILDRAAQVVMLNPVPNIPSYALHLGAVSMMHRFSRRDFFKAKEILQHLVERTPRWSMPYALLAKWNMLLVEQGWSEDPKRCGHLAKDFAHRALDRHESNALAHTVNGIVHCNLLHDLQGGLKCYEDALAVDPNEPLAWLSKGMAHAFLGDAQQAIADTQKACALSPLDPQRYYYTSLVASAHLTANDYAQAIRWAKESLRHNSCHVSTHRVLTIAQVLSGDVPSAQLSAQKLMALSPQLTVQSYLSRAPSAGFKRAAEFAKALNAAGVPQN